MQGKSDLRRRYKKRRSALTDKEQNHAAFQLQQMLVSDQRIQLANTISVYLSMGGEISLQPFIDWCWDSSKQVCLPLLHPFTKRQLLFQKYNKHTEMIQNQYAISEPKLACNQVVPLSQLDILIMPLVAFDRNKNRLGMGGGFYDSTLALLSKKETRPGFLGVAHGCQYHDNSLPSEPWDIALDCVITPDFII